MTTETTDPLEAVMEAAVAYRAFVPSGVGGSRSPHELRAYLTGQMEQARERLRLHVQLFGLKKQRGILEWTEQMLSGNVLDTVREASRNYDKEIAALEARLQEE